MGESMTTIFHRMVQIRHAGTLRPCCLLILLGMACSSLLFTPAVRTVSAEGPVTIYFYSSETNINNYKALKMEFDSYLSKAGSYEFQPFSDIDTFERQIRKGADHLLLLSSWHFNRIQDDLHLSPVLVGIREGKMFQQRVLVAGPGSRGLAGLGSGPVASASNAQHTRSVLKEMFEEDDKTEALRILTVPKDVDALMSVGFQMAKAAVTTENALKNLENLDPVLFQRIQVVAESRPSLLLILAAPAGKEADMQGLIRTMQEMPGDPAGLNALKMLDLDDWQTIDPSDTPELEG